MAERQCFERDDLARLARNVQESLQKNAGIREGNHYDNRNSQKHGGQNPDKGTFELALRSRSELRRSSVRLCWFVWRSDELEDRKMSAGYLLRLVPDVITVKPGAVVNFVPVFSGVTSLLCDFFVEGEQAGVITRDGIYTAPDKPGLYQVYAQARGRAEERAHSFVLVKEVEDGSGGV